MKFERFNLSQTPPSPEGGVYVVIDVIRAFSTAAFALGSGASRILLTGTVEEALELRGRFPRHACFVAQSSEASREYVARVHRLTRRLDDDPYTDCLWGILTGRDAAAALRIASWAEPLVVRKVAAGTDAVRAVAEAGDAPRCLTRVVGARTRRPATVAA